MSSFDNVSGAYLSAIGYKELLWHVENETPYLHPRCSAVLGLESLRTVGCEPSSHPQEKRDLGLDYCGRASRKAHCGVLGLKSAVQSYMRLPSTKLPSRVLSHSFSPMAVWSLGADNADTPDALACYRAHGPIWRDVSFC